MRVRLNRTWILCFNMKLKILQTISSLSSGSLDIVQNKSLPENFWPFSPMVSELFLQKYWLTFLPNGRQIMWQKFSTPSLSLLSLYSTESRSFLKLPDISKESPYMQLQVLRLGEWWKAADQARRRYKSLFIALSSDRVCHHLSRPITRFFAGFRRKEHVRNDWTMKNILERQSGNWC